MPSTSFFAAGQDVPDLLEFIYAYTDCRVLEAYSKYDSELREFASVSEIAKAFDLGRDSAGSGGTPYLMLYSPSTRGKLNLKRIALNPSTGGSYRYAVEGWGVMQLLLGGQHGASVTPSRLAHNSLARAKQWALQSDEPVDAWDWGALNRVSQDILKYVRRRAVAKKDSLLVLPEAANVLTSAGSEIAPKVRRNAE